MVTREGALTTQPEYVLRFAPPLTISNLLPFDITVVVTDAPSVTTAADPATFFIGVGGRAEVYQFDLTRKIRMSVRMQVSPPPLLLTPKTYRPARGLGPLLMHSLLMEWLVAAQPQHAVTRSTLRLCGVPGDVVCCSFGGFDRICSSRLFSIQVLPGL